MFSPTCCIDPRSVDGVVYVLATAATGLAAGLAAARAGGASALGAGLLLATGVLILALLAGPGDWRIERFTLVVVAPFAVVLGSVVRWALRGTP